MTNYILGFLIVFSPSLALAAPLGARGADVWDMVWSAGAVVQGVLLILVIFSVVSWGLILSKLKSLRDARKQNQQFEALFWNAGSLSAAQTQTATSRPAPWPRCSRWPTASWAR